LRQKKRKRAREPAREVRKNLRAAEAGKYASASRKVRTPANRPVGTAPKPGYMGNQKMRSRKRQGKKGRTQGKEGEKIATRPQGTESPK